MSRIYHTVKLHTFEAECAVKNVCVNNENTRKELWDMLMCNLERGCQYFEVT
jgi:hypothetical protein